MNDEKLKELKAFLEQLGWDMGLYDIDESGQLMSMVIGQSAYIGQLIEEFSNEEVLEVDKTDPTLH